MTDISDEEELLRRQLFKGSALPKTMPQPPVVDKVIATTVRQANVQTAGRDVLVLAISSFFAFLLVFCAPIMAASAAKNKRRSNGGTNPHNSNEY